MVNAWSLLYDEMYGPDDEANYVNWKKEKEENTNGGGGDSQDTISFEGAADWDYNAESWDEDTLNINFPISGAEAADTISIGGSGLFGGAGNDSFVFTGSHVLGGIGSDHITFNTDHKPQPNLKYKSQKYEEDKGIRDLKDYVSSTYNGHYTNDRSDVQTLDLIHSVGDAESFCRSNALKYLSRYDKKGSAKRDILKAMHYCLLLYYFSGNTNNETPTRGYETF